MKKLTIFVFLICILSLNALTYQEAMSHSENLITSMLGGQRNDLTQLFVNPYPYTLLMYYQAIEMQYTQMNQYVWNPVDEDWTMISDMIVEYDGIYPTTFTQNITVNEQEFTMIYEFTTTGGVVTNLLVSADYMGQMMETTRETYTFDGDHWVHLAAESNHVVQWVDEYQITATWSGDNITEVLEQDWYDDDRYWENSAVETWEYNGSIPTHYLSQYWDGLSWENDEQDDFTFAGDILVEELGQIWDNSAWVNDYKTTYNWNGEIPSTNMKYEWDGTQWINDQYVTYYEVEGNIGYVISEDWQDGDWVNAGKYEYFFGVANDDESIPQISTDLNNYPNPFNPTTNISFTMASEGHVTLDIYNVRGQKVETLYNGYKNAGPHTLTWDANVAGGIYFAVMNTGNERIVHKMVLLK